MSTAPGPLSPLLSLVCAQGNISAPVRPIHLDSADLRWRKAGSATPQRVDVIRGASDGVVPAFAIRRMRA